MLPVFDWRIFWAFSGDQNPGKKGLCDADIEDGFHI
jgi:hypothetical protein